MAIKKNILKHIVTGNWMGSNVNASNLYYMLSLVGLILIIIFNRYRAEELILEKRKLKEDVEILHSKHTKIETKLMFLGTERKVVSDTIILKLGLKLPETPPKQIIIK